MKWHAALGLLRTLSPALGQLHQNRLGECREDGVFMLETPVGSRCASVCFVLSEPFGSLIEIYIKASMALSASVSLPFLKGKKGGGIVSWPSAVVAATLALRVSCVFCMAVCWLGKEVDGDRQAGDSQTS